MKQELLEKLKILASAAKYDVSCASSGSKRDNKSKNIGNAVPLGVCHSFTEDGRCVSLLKIMMTNYCEYDCAYCINRKSNDVKRASLSPREIANITIEFYRRNYIEGVFLSSGIVKSPSYTMDRLVRVAKELRITHSYNGYIHLKSIPGADTELIHEAGLYADRQSVNIELSSNDSLKYLAPEKDHKRIFAPINFISQGILENKEERKKSRKVQKFTPAGQSTQLIVGASNDTDNSILTMSSLLYNKNRLKRVYYSGYIPVNEYDKRLPALPQPPMVRENRLYQADWLMRFYHFTVNEIVSDLHPNLDLDVDPKLSFALRHPEIFPINVNTADYELLLRIPGVGVKSAQMIISARRFGKLGYHQLQKMGIMLKRAKYFIETRELPSKTIHEVKPGRVKADLVSNSVRKRRANDLQYSLFNDHHFI